MKKINTNNSKTRTIINSEINSDAVIHFGGVSFDLAVEITDQGTIVPKIHLEKGEDTLHINKEGFDELREYYAEEHARTNEMYELFKKDLVKGLQKIPVLLEAGRCESDKMDDWRDQRSKKYDEKHGMAYISKAELDQMIQELNELRAQQGKKTTETEEEFEDVR